MTLAVRVRVDEGTPWGPATRFCRVNPLDGRTVCASHDVPSFADARELALHLVAFTGTCRLGWVCFPCGRVHGWDTPAVDREVGR